MAQTRQIVSTPSKMFALLALLLLSTIQANRGVEPVENQPPQQPMPPVKNGTAAGRYGGSNGGGYGGRYGSSESGEYEVAYGHSQRLIDDYICDLDASILVVTNSEKSYQKETYGGGGEQYGQQQEGSYEKPDYAAGRAKRGAGGYGEREERDYGSSKGQGGKQEDGYGESYSSGSYSVAKAHRLRCSAIAVNSDEDCRKCCHMAARKERSISKESIVGFIVDYDEVKEGRSDDYQQQPAGPYRTKRGADSEPIYPPAAKPEDYQPQPQYEKPKENDYGGGSEQQAGYGQNEGGYGGEQKQSGYGQEAQSYGGTDYQQPASYSYNYPQRPKNPRCVCCAPKVQSNSYSSNYGKKAKGGQGYGGGKSKQYGGGGYGERRNNDYGSRESNEDRGYGDDNGYGPMPPRKQSSKYGGGGYGNGQQSGEYGGGRPMPKYGGGGRRGRGYGGKRHGGKKYNNGPY